MRLSGIFILEDPQGKATGWYGVAASARGGKSRVVPTASG